MAELSSTTVWTEANLKAYYKFSSGALTTDETANAHTLTAISDPAETTGKYGGGVILDSTDAYSHADHADFKPTGAFSIGCWVKDAADDTVIMQSSARAGGLWGGVVIEQRLDGKVQLISQKNSGITENTDWKRVLSTNTIQDGNWHLVVGTWDTSNLNIYVDNNAVDQAAWANAPVYQATNYVRFGCANDTGTNTGFSTATLDEIFWIKGTAITAAQVLELYTSVDSGFLAIL